MNFQITLLIGHVIAAMLIIIVIGLALLPLLYVINIIFCILGAIAASRGEAYRYPFALRLVN